MARTSLSVCALRRLNVLDGAIVNDVPRDSWTPDHLRVLADHQRRSGLTIRNPDFQFRLVRRDVQWLNAVHEIPGPAKAFYEGDRSQVHIFTSGWIRHEKSLRRQAEQDLRYQKLVGKDGPHGQWAPESVLRACEESFEST
jgi:hypothetical protein